MNKIGIPSSQQGLILDGEFGTIESQNKKNLSWSLEVTHSVLDAYEKICKVRTVKFCAYLKESEKVVLKKIICSSRRKALKSIPKYLHTYTLIRQNQFIRFLQQKRLH